MEEVYLVADTRERYVHSFLGREFERSGLRWATQQINTGDYLVCRRAGREAPQVLACIERKTLCDFASSFKDGRYGNREKMLALRARTGCQLYYFLEGPAFPSHRTKYARIPYGNIHAAVTMLMLRDGVHVVQTKNEEHTAQRLREFVAAFGRIEVPFRFPTGPADTGAAPDAGAGAGADAAASGGRGLAPAALTGAGETSDDEYASRIWQRLRGVNLVTADVLAGALSVGALVEGHFPPARLREIRMPSNRPLRKDTRRGLRALAQGELTACAKVLSGVPGVVPATARQLLGQAPPATHPLAWLLRQGDGLAELRLEQRGGRRPRLGAERARRIIRLLGHRRGAEAGRAGSADEADGETEAAEADESGKAGKRDSETGRIEAAETDVSDKAAERDGETNRTKAGKRDSGTSRTEAGKRDGETDRTKAGKRDSETGRTEAAETDDSSKAGKRDNETSRTEANSSENMAKKEETALKIATVRGVGIGKARELVSEAPPGTDPAAWLLEQDIGELRVAHGRRRIRVGETRADRIRAVLQE
jgi:hypothetical protein